MTINNARIQLATAYPSVQPVKTAKGNTYRAEIQTEKGIASAYLKLLKIEDIVREALCAVLARVLYLPIHQAFYVYLDPSFVPGRMVGNADHIAFGLQQDCIPLVRVANDQLNDRIVLWGEALRCAVFDEWIVNRDRLPTNLLFAEDKVYWLIDHDEALPNYAAFDEPCYSQIMQLLSKDKNEFERFQIRRDALHIIEELKVIDWQFVMEQVNHSGLTGAAPLFEKHVSFLKNRALAMSGIINLCLGIKQHELHFTDPVIVGNKKGLIE